MVATDGFGSFWIISSPQCIRVAAQKVVRILQVNARYFFRVPCLSQEFCMDFCKYIEMICDETALIA